MDLKILHIQDHCTGCGACANICPKQCISLEQDSDGFYYPTYNSENCIECRLCENACHIVSKFEHTPVQRDKFFLYRSRNESILEKSTSGGVFTLFAAWVLQQNGVVYGSTYNSEKERLEVFSTDVKSLDELRKSKYIESYTGFAYSNVRDNLKQNRRVLYCGTPCQVRGLKQFLKTTHTNGELLITIDFACHGVPSNLMFKEFKKVFERKNKKVLAVDFRYKDFKRNQMWHNMTLSLLFSDGSQKKFGSNDYYYYYYQPFLDNLSLRKSCYNCDIAIHSDADFSVGDFWGIKKYRNNLDDNRGMSFICVNKPEKLAFFKEISSSDYVEPLPYEHIAYQYKDKREQRAKQLVKRNSFLSDVKNIGYKEAICKHYGRYSIVKIITTYKLKSFVKRMIGR